MSRIVVIDDEPVLRLTFRHILEQEGHEVWDAAEGWVGLDLCRSHRPDLVITDLLLPGQDGTQTLRVLQAEFPGVPVIAMSGGRVDPDPAEDKSVVDYLTKPVVAAILRERVQHLLKLD